MRDQLPPPQALRLEELEEAAAVVVGEGVIVEVVTTEKDPPFSRQHHLSSPSQTLMYLLLRLVHLQL